MSVPTLQVPVVTNWEVRAGGFTPLLGDTTQYRRPTQLEPRLYLPPHRAASFYIYPSIRQTGPIR